MRKKKKGGEREREGVGSSENKKKILLSEIDL
jgi:hypothetical protein